VTTVADVKAEEAWKHAEKHHESERPDNASLKIDYLRAIAAELRAARFRAQKAG
jgi:hypothetical protein